MEKSTYKSTTMGNIPLSFTGRHLLQALREEMTDMIQKAFEYGRDGKPLPSDDDWTPLSRARGRLAKYMSELETKTETKKACDFLEYIPVLDSRTSMLNRSIHPWQIYGRAERPKPDEVIRFGKQGYQLPPIPEGYELKIVGDVVTISPLVQTSSLDKQQGINIHRERIPTRETFAFSNIHGELVKKEGLRTLIRVSAPTKMKDGKRGIHLTKEQARSLGSWLMIQGSDGE